MTNSKIEFAYVYVVYYYNPYNVNHWQQNDPMVFSSMEGALTLIKNHTNERLENVNGNRWRQGWYWIDKLAIIDTYEHGLEWESQVYDGKSERLNGQVPLKFT